MTPRRALRRRAVGALPLDVTNEAHLRALARLIAAMDPWDRCEIMGLRAQARQSEQALLADLICIHGGASSLEAWLFWPAGQLDLATTPVAYAGAWRTAPRLASLALFGAKGCRARLPGLIAWLAARRDGFVRDHRVTVGEVKVLARHPARRWLDAMGGDPVNPLPGIGLGGEDYVQMIWRF